MRPTAELAATELRQVLPGHLLHMAAAVVAAASLVRQGAVAVRVAAVLVVILGSQSPVLQTLAVAVAVPGRQPRTLVPLADQVL